MRRVLTLCSALLALLALACSAGSGDKTDTSKTSKGAGGAATQAASAGRLVLVRDQRLLVRAPNGDEQVLLRTPANTFPTFPMWSPDGARIAYVQATVFTGQANADWGGDVYVVDANGGNPRLVWKHDQPGAQVEGLAWTPDGQALLLGYWLTIYRDNRYQGQVQRIERLDIAGGTRTTMVEGGLLPSVSRDGTRMAYRTQDDTGKGGVWVAALDGSGTRQVVELGSKFQAILGPRISPDGTAIAFSAFASQAAEPGPKTGGGGLRAALRNLRLRAAAAHGLPMEVWRVTVAHQAVTRLTSFGEDDPYPAWSADGKRLVVIATGGLYEVNADGSNLRKIGMGAFDGKVDVK